MLCVLFTETWCTVERTNICVRKCSNLFDKNISSQTEIRSKSNFSMATERCCKHVTHYVSIIKCKPLYLCTLLLGSWRQPQVWMSDCVLLMSILVNEYFVNYFDSAQSISWTRGKSCLHVYGPALNLSTFHGRFFSCRIITMSMSTRRSVV